MPDFDTFEQLFENMTLAEKFLAAHLVVTRLLTIFLSIASEAGEDVTIDRIRAGAGQMVARHQELYDRLTLL